MVAGGKVFYSLDSSLNKYPNILFLSLDLILNMM